MNSFWAHGDGRSVLNLMLYKAGLSTAFMGKYLNGYLEQGHSPVSATYVPAGWSNWNVAGWGYPGYNYTLNQVGTRHRFGNKPRDSLTDVISRLGVNYINRAAWGTRRSSWSWPRSHRISRMSRPSVTLIASPGHGRSLRLSDPRSTARPVVRAVKARAGDRLLLCSDGISDYVNDQQIAGLVAHDARNAAQALVEVALRQGAKDDLTAIVADVVPRVEPRDGWLDRLPAPTGGE